jgi:hypothetical protein
MTWIEWLEGHKTYVVGIITALISLLLVFKIIDWSTEQIAAIMAFIYAIFQMTQRSAMKSETKKVVESNEAVENKIAKLDKTMKESIA